tara:strand:+ start:567 stop:1700 length:1134 start_codon:yes stop_codon:yes gene_type:complete
MHRTKLIHVITSIDRGGAENQLIELIDQQRKKYDVEVFSLIGKNYWEKHLKKRKIKVSKPFNYVFISNFLVWINIIIASSFKLKKIIKKNKNKKIIVHAHLPPAELCCYILTFITSINFNFIISKHLDSGFINASNKRDRSLFFEFIAKLIVNKSNHVICISKAVKNYLVKTYLKKFEYKMTVCHYGLQINYNYREIRKLNSFFTIGTVARFVNQKRLDLLLKIFIEFNKKYTKSKLVIIGNGPNIYSIKNLINIHKLNKKVKIIKKSNNVIKEIKKFDVFALTSEFEGFGLVFLEAMYAQVPIIAFRVSAIPEIIKHEYNGLTIRFGDEKNYIKGLINLRNKNLRKKYIKNATKTLKKHFDIKLSSKKIDEVYSGL